MNSLPIVAYHSYRIIDLSHLRLFHNDCRYTFINLCLRLPSLN